MRCGMCELHLTSEVEKKVKVKKATASRHKKQLVVITEEELNENDFVEIIKPTGYEITSFEKGVAVKKLFGWR